MPLPWRSTQALLLIRLQTSWQKKGGGEGKGCWEEADGSLGGVETAELCKPMAVMQSAEGTRRGIGRKGHKSSSCLLHTAGHYASLAEPYGWSLQSVLSLYSSLVKTFHNYLSVYPHSLSHVSVHFKDCASNWWDLVVDEWTSMPVPGVRLGNRHPSLWCFIMEWVWGVSAPVTSGPWVCKWNWCQLLKLSHACRPTECGAI